MMGRVVSGWYFIWYGEWVGMCCVICAIVSGMVNGCLVRFGALWCLVRWMVEWFGGKVFCGIVYCMVAWCLGWLMVAWCLVSWMAALMVGGGVGTNVMAHGDNVSVVM